MGAMGAIAAAAAAAGMPSSAQAMGGRVETLEGSWSEEAPEGAEGIVYDPSLTYADLSTAYTNQQLDAMILDQQRVEEDYAFPSGKTIPALYINLRNKINRIGWGIGSGVEGNEDA